MPKLYLAGPLFTTAERMFNVAMSRALIAAGHETWLPQEREPREKTPAAIFANDVVGIDWADAVVACMDGPDPDSGTAWECGYAYAKGKPVVVYRTDMREAVECGAPFNLMLTESAVAVLSCHLGDVDQVVDAIRAALRGLRWDAPGR